MGEDRLRPLWNDADLDETEENLRAALLEETTDAGRAEVLTQLARVELKRGQLDAANALLDEAEGLAGDNGPACARVLLERGRVVRRSDGDSAALPFLEQAYSSALAEGQHFMAVDAAHSCALAGDMVAWTQRGLDLAMRYPAASYWRGTLLMNLGDWQWERSQNEQSLASFKASLVAREKETQNPFLTEYSRFGVARALRTLGRPAEAIPYLERAIEWCEEQQLDSPYVSQFREELAAAYDDAGRSADADALRAVRGQESSR